MPLPAMQEPSADLELMGNLSIGVVCIDDALDIAFINPSAEAMLSVSATRAASTNLLDLIEVPDSFLMRMHETLQSAQPCTDREVWLELPNNQRLLVDCTISPWTRQGSTVGILLELIPLDRQLRIAREDALLSQQQNTRSLMRGLAHEIKNPLGGIRGAAQLLEKELDDDSLHEYTGIIIRESDRLQHLIDRMLGPANRLEMKLLNIHAVLEHVRKIIRVEAGQKVDLVIDYDPSIPEIVSDNDRLVQVFLNIAANALHAVGSEGQIIFRTRVLNNFTIGSTRHKLMVCAEIVDNGHGISEELREQIFYPLVSDRQDGSGSGLGLSIAQTTANQLGGLIECRSEPDQTIFSVFLPMHYKPHSGIEQSKVLDAYATQHELG